MRQEKPDLPVQLVARGLKGLQGLPEQTLLFLDQQVRLENKAGKDQRVRPEVLGHKALPEIKEKLGLLDLLAQSARLDLLGQPEQIPP